MAHVSDERVLTPVTSVAHGSWLTSRLNRKWLFQSKKYYQIRVQHVRISRKRHLTCLYRTILIMAAIFGRKMRKIVRAVLRKTESYRPILLIFNSKHGIAHGYIWSKFEQNLTKITAVRVPHRKNLNGRYDIIKLRYRKSEKSDTGPCPGDYFCEISSKLAQPFRL